MIRVLVADVLAAAPFAPERGLGRGDEAKSFDAGESDQGTTRLLGAAYGLALSSGLALPILRVGCLRSGVAGIVGPKKPC